MRTFIDNTTSNINNTFCDSIITESNFDVLKVNGSHF